MQPVKRLVTICHHVVSGNSQTVRCAGHLLTLKFVLGLGVQIAAGQLVMLRAAVGSIWSCLALSLACLFARDVPAATAPLRYLFVVETSSATAPHKQEVLSLLSSQLASGLQGQMQAGELFVVWTYAQNVTTDRYLPAPWNPRSRELVGARTARSVDELWFSGEARLDRVLEKVLNEAKQTEVLTVVILNSAAVAMTGTPFDDQIAAAYSKGVRDANAALFVTTLLVKRGQVVGWSVGAVNGHESGPELVKAPTEMTLPVWPRDPGSAVTRSLARPVPPPGTSDSNPIPAQTQRIAADPVQPPAPGLTESEVLAKNDGQPLQSELVLTISPRSEAEEPDERPFTNMGLIASSGSSLESLTRSAMLPASSSVRGKDDKAQQVLPSVARPATAAVPAASVAQAAIQPGATQTAVVPVRKRAPGSKPEPTAIHSSPTARTPPQPAVGLPRAAHPVTAFHGSARDLTRPGSSADRFLVLGLALLIAAVGALVYFVRNRSQGERSSLISRSIADLPHLEPDGLQIRRLFARDGEIGRLRGVVPLADRAPGSCDGAGNQVEEQLRFKQR
jgi:hypothetical protein